MVGPASAVMPARLSGRRSLELDGGPGAPKPVLEKVDKAAAEKAKEALEGAGATVELK